MADDWRRGSRDLSDRPPLHAEATAQPTAAAGALPAEVGDRHLLVGVSHPSNDPARHRVFQIQAAYRPAVGGWEASVGEQNANEQLQGWQAGADGNAPSAFPTAAACLGDAVARLVTMVDQEAAAPDAESVTLTTPPSTATG